jgi:hypothetical protein
MATGGRCSKGGATICTVELVKQVNKAGGLLDTAGGRRKGARCVWGAPLFVTIVLLN